MTNNEKALWDNLNAHLLNKINSNVYKIYSNRLSLEIVDDSGVNILCPDAYAKALIEKNLGKVFEEIIKDFTKPNYWVKFQVAKTDQKSAPKKKQAVQSTELFKQEDFEKSAFEKSEKETTTTNKALEVSGISPRYRFENYLMGSNNQLAFAVAKAVAERPGETYNPLFIYSGVGLGKTHLMQAVGNQILKNRPSLKVVYVTAETFTNELIEAIQMSKGRGQYTINKFRAKFRNADVLLVDDVQFIVGRDTTQQEFFHTFNTLYLAQKQIVMTSDRPPRDFINLEERVKSRFGSGMIVDIQPPEYDMRVAILRQKRDDSGDPVSNEVIDLLAKNIVTNVRELLGAYLQLITKYITEGKSITPDLVLAELGQRTEFQKRKPVNINQILKAVCNYYSVKAEDVKGQRRTKDIVIPRQMIMYLIYDLTKTPYMTIGEFLGGRDHTTILHGVRKIESDLKSDVKTKNDVANILQNVSNG